MAQAPSVLAEVATLLAHASARIHSRVWAGFSESTEQFGGNRRADNAGPAVPDLPIYSLCWLCSFFRSFVMESFRLTKQRGLT